MTRPANRFIARLTHQAYPVWMQLRRPVTLGVKPAIFDDGGRVLLVKHSYTEGWHLPGGGVSRDETLREAMMREVIEELGLRVLDPVVLEASYFAPHMGKSDHIALFRVTAYEGEIARNWEIAEAEFFDPHALPADTTAATCRRIEELTGNRRIEDRW